VAELKSSLARLGDVAGHTHTTRFFQRVASTALLVDCDIIEKIVARLAERRGRVYVIGMGGSLANAIHMAADLRKLCDIDAEAFDNIAEITARLNDDDPDDLFQNWLKRHTEDDCLFVLSVGGGTESVSAGISRAVREFTGTVCGIVGPSGGKTAEHGTLVVRIPASPAEWTTPLTEAFQAVVWHCIVSHPLLQVNKPKW